MDANIEQWRVQQYAANVYQLAQQKGARLASLVRNESFLGKAEFFDRIGTATAQAKGGRNGATPNLNIVLSRRMVTTAMYEWATLVDRKDRLAQIHDPESQFAVAAYNALGRAMDDVIIAAAFGAADSGEDGSTPVVLPNTQKIASVAAGATAPLNLNCLLNCKQALDESEVEGPRYFVHTAAMLKALLGTTQVTSADFNTVKALVNGEIDTYLGFKFIHSERLPKDNSVGWTFDPATGLYKNAGTALTGGEVSGLILVGDGLLLGKNEGAVAKIDERPDLSYSKQVYASMDFGAVRMEEVKIIEVIATKA